MKKIVYSLLLILGIAGIVYSSGKIYTNVRDNSQIAKLEKEIAELKKVEEETTKLLEEKTSEEAQVRTEYRNKIGEKVVYLTFDDGPTQNTLEVLEILKKNNIKATFFVIGQNFDLYKNIVDEGHEIAIHTFTHDYKTVYASEKNFFDDFYRLRDKIKEVTGVDAKVTRFPGGSSNRKATRALMKTLIARLNKEGYVYQDWNCDSTDASGVNVPVEKILRNSTNCHAKEINLLMHDAFAKKTTVAALQGIIDSYRQRGYTFDVLTVDSPKFQHVK